MMRQMHISLVIQRILIVFCLTANKADQSLMTTCYCLLMMPQMYIPIFAEIGIKMVVMWVRGYKRVLLDWVVTTVHEFFTMLYKPLCFFWGVCFGWTVRMSDECRPDSYLVVVWERGESVVDPLRKHLMNQCSSQSLILHMTGDLSVMLTIDNLETFFFLFLGGGCDGRE